MHVFLVIIYIEGKSAVFRNTFEIVNCEKLAKIHITLNNKFTYLIGHLASSILIRSKYFNFKTEKSSKKTILDTLKAIFLHVNESF